MQFAKLMSDKRGDHTHTFIFVALNGNWKDESFACVQDKGSASSSIGKCRAEWEAIRNNHL